MGIYGLRKFIDLYVQQRTNMKPIHSDICYVDFTSRIYDIVERVTGKIKPDLEPIDLINEILDMSVNSLLKQITNNRFYNRFIIAFDYRYITKMNRLFKLSDEVYEVCRSKTLTKKEQVESTTMIPKSMIDLNTLSLKTDMDTVKEHIRNLYEVRYNYWNPNKNIINNYVSMDYLLELVNKDSNKDSLRVLNELNRLGFTRYLLIRGAKNFSRNIKSESVNPSKEDITTRLSRIDSNEEFNEEFKNYFKSIPYGMIINLAPTIIKRVKERLTRMKSNIEVEFIGCEDESDFAIARHIYKTHRGNCPTIYSKDTDFFLLLCKHNCLIKLPYNNHNVSIYTCDFWKWLLNTDTYTYSDVVAISCMLGTSYNKYKPKSLTLKTLEEIRNRISNENLYETVWNTAIEISKDTHTTHNRTIEFILAMEIYNQSELIENEVHYIEPQELDIESINFKLSNFYTDLLL